MWDRRHPEGRPRRGRALEGKPPWAGVLWLCTPRSPGALSQPVWPPLTGAMDQMGRSWVAQARHAVPGSGRSRRTSGALGAVPDLL